MDPRYQWPQGYPNNQYGAPPQTNGYHANGYPIQYQQQQQPLQQMPQGYPQSQPFQGQPRVVIPPRANQTYPQTHDDPRIQPQPRPGQPQVMIPTARPQGYIPQVQNQRIRQVQVPVQRPVQRTSNGASRNEVTAGQPRQAQTPVQRTQSLQQQTTPRPQQRTPSLPTSNQSRAPLQPQATPTQTRPLHSSPSQHPNSSPYAVSSQKSHPKVVIKQSTPHSTPNASNQQNGAPSKALPEDLTVLLLAAADEYINAARGLGARVAPVQSQADRQQYYQLMAAGLGCMEAVLKKFNQSPREEAKLRLRYASLLVEETDNHAEIDAVLAKGIALCDRSRLLDLKYSMHHLQARYQFQSNHRAALKALDKPIQDAETLQHISWVYAFRFLKLSLALQVPGRPEIATALQQLRAITSHAERRGDRAIYVTSSTFEAMVHLRSSGSDHIEHAQRAIAAARSQQLQLSAKQLGSIATLIDCIDIACTLRRGGQDEEKMLALQQKVDKEPVPHDGTFGVLIENNAEGGVSISSTGGIFRRAQDGRDELSLAWLPKKDLNMLAYYLSGLMSLNKHKGLSYLQEGFKLTQDALQRHPSRAMSLTASITQNNWLTLLDWQLRFTLGLVTSSWQHEDRPVARKHLRALQKSIGSEPFTSEVHGRLSSYLAGILDQTNGNFDSALSIYGSDDFALPAPGVHTNNLITDLAILAAMNRLLILRDPMHPEHFLTGILFTQLQPLCNDHPNQYINLAFRIVTAITQSDVPLNRQKTLMHTSTSTSQQLGNLQFMTMCLSYVTARFFWDTVSEQALRGTRASRQIANKSESKLWKAVASGICMNGFSKNGFPNDAQAARTAFLEMKDQLPPPFTGGVPVAQDQQLLGTEIF
ncbi:cohesin loading factor-domain-containing protein [Lophiotrema nucula]|uniref:Cohesin loading factor-domain-containing protein n=1 Tax=Lophiotrema nucula TaxID=690887 RepID=A0A6A5ZGX5_9PLEO|nr:cohesin loading factor-domain-containing protein [Lophiotrema nucula]